MGTGNYGGFGNTLGSTYANGSIDDGSISYSDRGIDIPAHVKELLGKLPHKGDYVTGNKNDFNMSDVSLLSKEAKVEFAKVTIGNKTYLIRGDERGTTIPKSILNKMEKESGRLEFHSHPHNDDCVPSAADRKLIGRLSRITGQKTSTIVTPNGRTAVFNEHGVVETGTVPNSIDQAHKQALLKLFGGK